MKFVLYYIYVMVELDNKLENHENATPRQRK
jgi:hypothetical protein